MTSAPEKVDDRTIFYKHDDSNFYPALSYVLGQALALIPQMLIDVLLFGTFVYWLVGFTATASVRRRSHFGRDGLFRMLLTLIALQGFILYLALFFSFTFTMGQLFGLLAAVAPNKTVVQASGAVILLLNTLFCGEWTRILSCWGDSLRTSGCPNMTHATCRITCCRLHCQSYRHPRLLCEHCC